MSRLLCRTLRDKLTLFRGLAPGHTCQPTVSVCQSDMCAVQGALSACQGGGQAVTPGLQLLHLPLKAHHNAALRRHSGCVVAGLVMHPCL